MLGRYDLQTSEKKKIKRPLSRKLLSTKLRGLVIIESVESLLEGNIKIRAGRLGCAA